MTIRLPLLFFPVLQFSIAPLPQSQYSVTLMIKNGTQIAGYKETMKGMVLSNSFDIQRVFRGKGPLLQRTPLTMVDELW